MKQKTLTFLIALTVLFSFAIPAVAVDTGFSDVRKLSIMSGSRD